jgi:phospholipid/cholesterol/gamma-HCH transport system substrate-binding protein
MRRRQNGMNPITAGVIAVAVIAVVVFFAFNKGNPFSSPYELNAVFESANNLGVNSPVRTAGVDVGKVKEVEPMGDGSGLAKVRMEIYDKGLPIKRDATLKIRSRLFLEGNYFVDLRPGSPSAPELGDGGTIPPSQTAFPVQFGQVLQALQSDTREDLQILFRELAVGYSGTGPIGLNQLFEYQERAYKNTALVNAALLGRERHDLSRLLDGQAKVFGALSRNERTLADLVTDLNTTLGAFASQEDALTAVIPELRDVLRVGEPALRSVDSSLPSIRAFARDALPGARSSPATLDAQIPFIRQARGLVSEAEARGLVRDLRPTVPALAQLNRGSARTFQQTRALASCQNKVLLPFSRTPIPDPAFANSGHHNEPFFEESPRALVGLAGESRQADANSAFFRVLTGTGPTTLFSTGETGDLVFGQAPTALAGTRPPKPTSSPVFRPDIPCEINEPPDLNTTTAPGDTTTPPPPPPPGGLPSLPPLLPKEAREKARENDVPIELIEQHLKDKAAGRPTIDPLAFSERGRRLQARRLGLRPLPGGRYERIKKDKDGDR